MRVCNHGVDGYKDEDKSFVFWVLEVGSVNDEDCSEHVGYLF